MHKMAEAIRGGAEMEDAETKMCFEMDSVKFQPSPVEMCRKRRVQMHTFTVKRHIRNLELSRIREKCKKLVSYVTDA